MAREEGGRGGGGELQSQSRFCSPYIPVDRPVSSQSRTHGPLSLTRSILTSRSRNPTAGRTSRHGRRPQLSSEGHPRTKAVLSIATERFDRFRFLGAR